jgi:hypothetical protein
MSEQYQLNEAKVEQHQQQQEVSKNIQTNTICLFGLSGDPPTGYGGHVGIVQTIQQLNIFHEIWVIPVYKHTYTVSIILFLLFTIMDYFLTVKYFLYRKNVKDWCHLNIDFVCVNWHLHI